MSYSQDTVSYKIISLSYLTCGDVLHLCSLKLLPIFLYKNGSDKKSKMSMYFFNHSQLCHITDPIIALFEPYE